MYDTWVYIMGTLRYTLNDKYINTKEKEKESKEKKKKN